MVDQARHWALAATVALALGVAGCGGGSSTTAKKGDCVNAASAGRATVVACGSAQAKATLVDNGESSAKAIACVTITPGSAQDFSVTVGGKVYCARPKGAGATTAAFNAGLHRIESPYKAMGQDVVTELNNAASQSYAVFGAKMAALANRASSLSRQLDQLSAPAAVQSDFFKLRDGTTKVVVDLERMRADAAAHNAAGVRSANNDLQQAFSEVADGITGLKRKGVK